MRRRLLPLAVTAVTVVTAVVAVRHFDKGTRPQGCTVAAPIAPYHLDLEQAANAATIAAVGMKKGLPDHAVTVALATALQESKLHNVAYGDLDSVGLFQQRPSQGWGTPAQLMQPSYAAAAFYSRLSRVPGWAMLPVTNAAQHVQRSAAPSAYAQWESEARAIAGALTGEGAAGISCSFHEKPSTRGPQIDQAVTVAFGPRALGVPVDAKRGWAIAAWVVANARDHDVSAVTFAGREWSARTGRWRTTAGNDLIVRVR